MLMWVWWANGGESCLPTVESCSNWVSPLTDEYGQNVKVFIFLDEEENRGKWAWKSWNLTLAFVDVVAAKKSRFISLLFLILSLTLLLEVFMI